MALAEIRIFSPNNLRGLLSQSLCNEGYGTFNAYKILPSHTPSEKSPIMVAASRADWEVLPNLQRELDEALPGFLNAMSRQFEGVHPQDRHALPQKADEITLAYFPKRPNQQK